MKNFMNRFALFASRVVFSAITPPLLIPAIGNLRLTWFLIAFFFGHLYGNRYEDIIASFQGGYGLAMAKGMVYAGRQAKEPISVVADCGTGTGFVTRQAAETFPRAVILAFDLLPSMLEQARRNCESIPAKIFHVQADTFALPLADDSIDLLLVQNTMPCFSEFARVCRPGGMVIYVDTAAGWISILVKRLIERQGLFAKVTSEKVDIGFYVVAQKAGPGNEVLKTTRPNGNAKKADMESYICCPLDKSPLIADFERLRCRNGHSYPVRNGFPVMIIRR